MTSFGLSRAHGSSRQYLQIRGAKAILRLGRCYASSYSTPAPAGPSTSEVRGAQDYCTQLLRKYDTPSHTLLAFIPPAAQTAYLAIRAFNIELARIPDSVSISAVAAMRYQFWRDNITRAFSGTPPKQPVSVLLAHAIAHLELRTDGASKLSRNWFMRIITAREHYSDGRPYPTLDALEKYAENTYSTLLYLTLQSLPMASVTADHVASHIGKANGIVAVLRGLPLVAFPPPPNHHSNSGAMVGGLERTKQGGVLLPLDVMAKSNVKEEDVLRRGAEAPGLRDAIFEVATRASDHLITAREMAKNVRKGQDIDHAFEYEGQEGHIYDEANQGRLDGNRQLHDLDSAFGVLMPAISTKLWLDKLQKYDFDVFREELRRRDWKLPFRAYFANRARTF